MGALQVVPRGQTVAGRAARQGDQAVVLRAAHRAGNGQIPHSPSLNVARVGPSSSCPIAAQASSAVRVTSVYWSSAGGPRGNGPIVQPPFVIVSTSGAMCIESGVSPAR